MYSFDQNQHSPEPTLTDQEKKDFLMRELAEILAADPNRPLPWAYAPGVGLTVCCGIMRITFVESSLLRDRQRANLVLEVFDDLSHDHRTYEFRGQAPQVKLTKSAVAIANQLQRSGVIEQLAMYAEIVRDKNRIFRQEGQAALTTLKEIAALAPQQLDVRPVSPGMAKLMGSLELVKVEMGTRWHRPSDIDQLNLSHLSAGEAQAVIAALIKYQAEESCND